MILKLVLVSAVVASVAALTINHDNIPVGYVGVCIWVTD